MSTRSVPGNHVVQLRGLALGTTSPPSKRPQDRDVYRNPIASRRPFDRVTRFECISDPADEAIVFALHCREDGIKGTYTVPFGPGMGALDAKMMHRLRDAKGE